MTATNTAFQVCSFLGFLLSAIPFPWHFEAWNTGTCLFMAWSSVACLNSFVNSVVWDGNAINWAPVWCDISARIIIGNSIGIAAASLCINRRLYHIASMKTVTITMAQKRRAVIFDLVLGLGCPILVMALQYIVQGHRFDIYEDIGCFPFTYLTPVAEVLVKAPPVAIGVVSAFYSVASIVAFRRSHAQFQELLSGNRNLNSSRYIRLMCLAGISVLCLVPLTLYAMLADFVNGGLSPWKGWADTHYGFSRVDQIPYVLWHSSPAAVHGLEITRWSNVACAFAFFAFFGFADEARKNYWIAARSVVKLVSTGSSSTGLLTSNGTKSKGISTSGKGNMTIFGKGNVTIASFIQRQTVRRKNSLDSDTATDKSISYADVGGILNEKETAFSPTLSFDAPSLKDVGNTLGQAKELRYSATVSSGSSVISLPAHVTVPSMPEPALTAPEYTIEISSVRHLSVSSPDYDVQFPEPALDISSRQVTTAPLDHVPRNSVDMV